MTVKATPSEILINMVRSVTSTSDIIDKATSWAMAGISAAIIVIVSNMEAVLYQFSKSEIKVMLIFLLIAFVCGFLEKIFYVRTTQLYKINIKLINMRMIKCRLVIQVDNVCLLNNHQYNVLPWDYVTFHFL